MWRHLRTKQCYQTSQDNSVRSGVQTGQTIRLQHEDDNSEVPQFNPQQFVAGSQTKFQKTKVSYKLDKNVENLLSALICHDNLSINQIYKSMFIRKNMNVKSLKEYSKVNPISKIIYMYYEKVQNSVKKEIKEILSNGGKFTMNLEEVKFQ